MTIRTGFSSLGWCVCDRPIGHEGCLSPWGTIPAEGVLDALYASGPCAVPACGRYRQHGFGPHQRSARSARASAVAGRRALLAKGDVEAATDSLEAALTIDPANAGILVALGNAARQAGLQGKAIHYYRNVLDREPNNLDAIAGEGAALAEKGAVDKAKATLTRLEGLCGKSCPEAGEVSKALAAGPKPQVVAAETVAPKPDVQAN
jgi:predicted Zn-dependent protease